MRSMRLCHGIVIDDDGSAATFCLSCKRHGWRNGTTAEETHVELNRRFVITSRSNGVHDDDKRIQYDNSKLGNESALPMMRRASVEKRAKRKKSDARPEVRVDSLFQQKTCRHTLL